MNRPLAFLLTATIVCSVCTASVMLMNLNFTTSMIVGGVVGAFANDIYQALRKWGANGK